MVHVCARMVNVLFNIGNFLQKSIEFLFCALKHSSDPANISKYRKHLFIVQRVNIIEEQFHHLAPYIELSDIYNGYKSIFYRITVSFHEFFIGKIHQLLLLAT